MKYDEIHPFCPFCPCVEAILDHSRPISRPFLQDCIPRANFDTFLWALAICSETLSERPRMRSRSSKS